MPWHKVVTMENTTLQLAVFQDCLSYVYCSAKHHDQSQHWEERFIHFLQQVRKSGQELVQEPEGGTEAKRLLLTGMCVSC